MDGVYKKRTHETHMKDHLPYVRDSKNAIKVVLLGTSHFERLTWFNRKISERKPKDTFVASVGGDRVENILYRLQTKDGLIHAFKKRKPPLEAIVLMAGGNNLLAKQGKSDRPEEIVEKMRFVIRYLRKELPQVYLFVWAIPRDRKRSKEINMYNTLLKTMCEEEIKEDKEGHICFSDQVFRQTWKEKDYIFHDDVHLSRKGYEKCMLPYLPTTYTIAQ